VSPFFYHRALRRALQIAAAVAAFICVALFCAFLLHFYIVAGLFDGPFRNPYARENVCYRRDTPGATSRYVEYTFAACDAPHVALAEPMGADQAVLSFEDLDGDGRPEAVIESSSYKCTYGGLGCYGAYRIVLDICGDCEVKVRKRSERHLPHLEWSL
jgi:hypothetical protein